MGDRYITINDCPVCGEKYECYDAPSSVMYVAMCDNCGYEEPDYYIEKKRKLTELERELTGETHTYDLEMRRHTKEQMRRRYETLGKDAEWIEKALEVDYSTKVRMVDISTLQDKISGYTRNIKFDKMLKMVLECEVK